MYVDKKKKKMRHIRTVSSQLNETRMRIYIWSLRTKRYNFKEAIVKKKNCMEQININSKKKLVKLCKRTKID